MSKRCRPVVVTDAEGNEKYYESCAIAADALKVTTVWIYLALKKGYKVRRNTIKYA